MSEENGKQSVSDKPARKENHPGVVATEPYVTPKKVDNRKRSYDGRGSKIAIVKSCTQELLLNGESVTRCILEDGCDYIQKVFRQSNFERHFRLCHPVAFDVLGIGPPSEKSSSPNTEPAISIRMTVQRLLGGIVKLVTVHGLPFEAMEWEGFTEVVGPLLKAYNLTINRHNITKYVAKAAEGVNWMISQEVNGRMISLKLDIVSKMYRSMLGINCQYINNSGVVTKRNLGIIELHNRHTSQNLKEELHKVLKSFAVNVGQITAITIDNASNMVKLVKLMSDESGSTSELYDSENEEVNSVNEVEADDFEGLEHDSPEKPAVQEWVRVLEDFAPDESITAVRCGAHTTQLVVHDVCKQIEHKDALKEIRKTVKKFRCTEYKAFFDISEGAAYPSLPNETRWNSDYKMQQKLSQERIFFEKLGKQYPDLDLSNHWDFIEEYVTAFEALYHCTIAVQKLDTTLSDFFIEWIRAYGRIWEIDETNRFKQQLITAMENRQQKLFCNRVFRTAVYFDPRLNFNGSSLLSQAQKEDAVRFCLQMWTRIKSETKCSENGSDENDSAIANTKNAPTTDGPSCSKFSLNHYLTRTIGSGSPQTVQLTSLEQRIRAVQYQKRIDADAPFSTIQYWAAKRFEDPQVWEIAKVVLGVPGTQCSIERDFNLFNLTLTKSRSKLSSKSLQDILTVRTNKNLVKPGLAYMLAKDKQTLEELTTAT
ncbi:uncharacterized protein LOC115266423 [Aedes albopictus]|uniref:HAT C-terminal dimerisation domain-containing protein n=1 Tax=Aedes albopictus TaxID=7160 RepID=A0ABM1YXW7_AEDAL